MTICITSAPVAAGDNDTNPETIAAVAVAVEPDTGAAPVQRPSIHDKKRILFTPEPEKHGFLNDWLFPLLCIVAGSGCLAAALYARNIPPVQQAIAKTMVKIKTEFQLTEQKQKVEEPPVIKKKKIKPPEPPIDLTEKIPVATEPPVEETPQEQPEVRRPPVRKVFGLRKVYSTGLGSGGSMSDAVVGKIGNTINKEYDTVTATESDIKGTVVSTVTVTTAPRFRKVVKPEYTKEMIERKVEGTVKVKVLVDIDGKVKKATCLNDIGFDSASQAVKATLAMEFDPAMRGDDPVAVWIIVPIRFVLLG